jgi:hypothetical protein
VNGKFGAIAGFDVNVGSEVIRGAIEEVSWETGGIVEFEGMRSLAVGVVGVDAWVGEVRGGSDCGDDRLGDSGSRMLLGKPGMRLLSGKSSAD